MLLLAAPEVKPPVASAKAKVVARGSHPTAAKSKAAAKARGREVMLLHGCVRRGGTKHAATVQVRRRNRSSILRRWSSHEPETGQSDYRAGRGQH